MWEIYKAILARVSKNLTLYLIKLAISCSLLMLSSSLAPPPLLRPPFFAPPTSYLLSSGDGSSTSQQSEEHRSPSAMALAVRVHDDINKVMYFA